MNSSVILSRDQMNESNGGKGGGGEGAGVGSCAESQEGSI